ncbi:MAG: hypothetical protein ACP5UQ_13035 [Anaerolineae bacterium]
MDLLNPLVVRMVGANINRRTLENVRRAGLTVIEVEHLRGELVRLIHARPAASSHLHNLLARAEQLLNNSPLY